MTSRLLPLLVLAACTPDAPKDTGSPAGTDTGSGDTADSGADTADTGGDTVDTSDTADTEDSGSASIQDCTGTPKVVWNNGGVWTDVTASFPSVLPANYVYLDAGEYRFCGGVWYAYLITRGAVTLAGYDDATLDAGGASSVITIKSVSDVAVSNLTLRGGKALSYGGGLNCSQAGAVVTLTDVGITANDGNGSGGGLGVNGCTVHMTGGSITENVAGSGAAIFITGTGDSTVNLTNVEVTANSASLYAGGAQLQASPGRATLNLVDTVFSDNTSTWGAGALLLEYNSAVTCAGSSSGKAGFRRNSAPYGGVAVIGAADVGTPSFMATDCDMGEDGGVDDNSPDDLYFASTATTVEYGDAATFICDAAACN